MQLHPNPSLVYVSVAGDASKSIDLFSVKSMSYATSHRAVLAETAGEPARPVCVLRSDVPGLGNIQLTRERSTVVIGRSRSVDYRIDHPQAPRSSRPSLTHRNSPRPPACWPSLRVVVHS